MRRVLLIYMYHKMNIQFENVKMANKNAIPKKNLVNKSSRNP